MKIKMKALQKSWKVRACNALKKGIKRWRQTLENKEFHNQRMDMARHRVSMVSTYFFFLHAITKLTLSGVISYGFFYNKV
jgi:hypothetical protein